MCLDFPSNTQWIIKEENYSPAELETCDPKIILGHIIIWRYYQIKASRHFKRKKKGYLKDKSNYLAKSSRSKNIRDMNRE
jgi:hypothetical protein